MQKLLIEFKNTPENTPQVLCSVSEVLNREETLNVPYKVLADNSSDEDLHSGRSGQDLRVPVINMHKQPLMPTTPRKARIFLKQKKAKQTLKSATFMNIVRWRLVNTLKCAWTYGYITKHDRIKMKLEKSHVNDAFVIAGGTTQSRSVPYMTTQTRRNNRSIQTNRKGFKPAIRRQRYKLQPGDLVKYIKYLFRVKGVFNYGKWVRLISLTKANKIINVNIKKVELVKYGKGIQFKKDGN
ncbi:hypothetical protein BMS3Bbin15_00430 [archaeon BMS3Bbin15]|nr:hypothetical protein BMS3Bbin15_00430 [archaeon BMS3Bbin15]